jgi:hypothetical protein
LKCYHGDGRIGKSAVRPSLDFSLYSYTLAGTM